MGIPTIKFSVSRPVLTEVPKNPDGTNAEINTGDVFTTVDSNGIIGTVVKTEEGYASTSEIVLETEETDGTEI